MDRDFRDYFGKYLGKYCFYNSYLPEIAYPEQHDRVSAKALCLVTLVL
jgi:hypothetical protein